MIKKLLNLINEKYPLYQLNCGEFAKMNIKGVKFNIAAFKAKGLGHVSVMRGSCMMGLMKMDTIIINPTELDLPLYSYDRIFALGNDTLIVEMYDTLLSEYDQAKMQSIKEKYTDLPERDPGEHWYDSLKLASSISKKGKKKQSERLDELATWHFEVYLGSSRIPVTDKEAKQNKAGLYVNGLIEKGGPSTDVFKGAIGEEKTRILFENILFGTK